MLDKLSDDVKGTAPTKPWTREERIQVIDGWISLLVARREVFEIRALKVHPKGYRGKPYTEAGYFDRAHSASAAEFALEMTERAKGVYITLNPVDPALLARCCNRIGRAEEGTQTKDGEVIRRHWLFVDIDPIRATNISASDEEKAVAHALTLSVRDYLCESGWPDPIIGDSGNGNCLLYAIDLPANDGGLIERCLQALDRRFSNKRVKVDTSVGNQARIIKVPGTFARKGDNVADRPHRRSKWLEVPDCPDPLDVTAARIELVSEDRLRALADELPAVGLPPPKHSANGRGRPAPEGTRYECRLDVERWLTARGVGFRRKSEPDAQGRTIWQLEECPFDSSHAKVDAAVMQWPDGKLGAKCFHNSCAGRGWQDFKQAIGEPEPEHWEPPLRPRPARSSNAPLLPPADDKGQQARDVLNALREQAAKDTVAAATAALAPEAIGALARLWGEAPGDVEAFFLSLQEGKKVTASRVGHLRQAVKQQAKILRHERRRSSRNLRAVVRAPSSQTDSTPPSPPPGGEGTDPPPSEGVGTTGATECDAREAITNPHRLARLYRLHCASHADRDRVAYYQDFFWRWTGGRWCMTPDKEMEGVMASFCSTQLAIDAAAVAEGWSDPEREPPPVPPVTSSMVRDVLLALRGETQLRSDVTQPMWIGANPGPRPWIALRNGILDVDAFLEGLHDVLRPHSPWWFSPTCLPYDFDPNATCPKWMGFVNRNLGDDAGKPVVLQQYAGYLLLPDLSMQQYLEMFGEGNNGKSVACAGFRAMLGDDNVSAVPLELFGDKFRLAGTLGKLLNVIAEVGELDKIAEGQLKSFVAGDKMEFERKFKAPFSAHPTARLLLATNNPPMFSDKSDGIFRRRIPLPFTVQIHDDEKIPDMDKVEFWVRSGELPGILNWALAGLDSLRRAKRFTIPQCCQDAALRLRVEADPARRFLLEKYKAADGRTPTARVYAEYSQWCSANGHYRQADVGFGKAVLRVFKAVKIGKVTISEDTVGQPLENEHGVVTPRRVNAYLGLVRKEDMED